MTYYNEHDPKAAAWLRELIRRGHIPKGTVDERSIKLIDADELSGFAQCHFFAGVGGWPRALRLAGWDDERPVWSGSCPCQPFSSIGQRKGKDDPRHLWPDFYRLIRKRRPSAVFGEQVASKDAELWLDGVFADMEASGYACGASDLCAAGIGAPQLRQRFYWVGYADCAHADRRTPSREQSLHYPHLDSVRLVGSEGGRRGELGHATFPRSGGHAIGPGWARFDVLHCRDGKARRIEPGTFPLADGIPGRMGLLRGYGNAILPDLAAEFIQACEEALTT
jgi:DNA (cytosine-5)-methyltransferase 1